MIVKVPRGMQDILPADVGRWHAVEARARDLARHRRPAETARRAGARAIAWTGATGGKVADLAELVVRVPARTIEQVEDGHMVLAHALTVYLRARLRERTLLQENVSAARGTGGGAVTE